MPSARPLLLVLALLCHRGEALTQPSRSELVLTGRSTLQGAKGAAASRRQPPARRPGFSLRGGGGGGGVWINEFEEAVLDTSLWMCLTLTSLVPFVQKSLQLELSFAPVFIGFTEALCVYSLDRCRDNADREDPRSQQLVRRSSRLGAAGAVGLTVALVRAPLGSKLVFLSHILFGLLYAMRLPVVFGSWRERRTWRIKELPCSKAFFVALSTSFMALFAPLAYSRCAQRPAGRDVQVTFALITLLSFSVETLQDIRDMREDRAGGTVTLALALGPRGSKWLLTGVWLVFSLMQVREEAAKRAALHLCVALIVVMLVWSPVLVSTKFFYSFLLESIFLSPLFFLSVLDLFFNRHAASL